MNKEIKILVITPTNHIEGLNNNLKKIGSIKFMIDPELLTTTP